MNNFEETQDNFEGWNLIGNPFTSAIDWDQVSLNNVENVIYYFDGASANYKYYGTGGDAYDQGITVNGGSQFVPANQGFFVKTTANNGTVTIPTSARTHNSQAFWKKSQETVNNLLRLEIKNSGFTDETVIRTLPDATENHDAKYDAHKLFSYDKTKPMLYSRNEDNSHIYAINTIPEFKNEKIIPLGMYIGLNSNYTISLTENGFDKTHIYLEDRDLNEFINLTYAENYSFWQNAIDFSDRFYLHLKQNSAPVLNAEIPDQEIKTGEIYNYTIPSNIFVDNDSGDILTYKVSLENGDSLPSWLNFNVKSGQFSGTPDNIQTINIKITASDIFGATVSDVYKLTVTSGSLISEITGNDINVFPNPTDGKFVIELNSPVKGSISVVDISGKTLLIKTINSNICKIDLTDYPKGIYIVTVNTETQSVKKKIIKK